MLICLMSGLTLVGCGDTHLVTTSGGAPVMRNGHLIENHPVFIPSKDGDAWVPARADIPVGKWLIDNLDSEVK